MKGFHGIIRDALVLSMFLTLSGETTVLCRWFSGVGGCTEFSGDVASKTGSIVGAPRFVYKSTSNPNNTTTFFQFLYF